MNEDNKRIIRNSGLLYVRLFLSLAISLFTSREILRILGVEDFGVYNIVGGVIAMFAVLNASMNVATARFITYELGVDGRSEKLRHTFASTLLVHVAIAVVVVILGETVGLWFVMNELVIPEGSRTAALWVYQFSVATAALSITQVPYNAALVAHERIDLFTYIEIGTIVMKLVIVYLLLVLPGDKLIIYAALVFAVQGGAMVINRVIAMRRFPEARTGPGWHPKVLKPILSFSGIDFFGNFSVVARSSGVQIVLNLFFGAVINAAAGIALSVQGVVMNFATNISTAMRPQIIKSYASGDYRRTTSLLLSGSNLIYALLFVISLPLIANMDFVLNLWLTEVPGYTVQFAIWTLLFNLFSGMSVIGAAGCHACGKIMRLSFLNGAFYLSVVPVSYIAFRWFDSSPVLPYVYNAVAMVAGCLSNAWTCHLYVPGFTMGRFFRIVLVRCALVSLAGWAVIALLGLQFPDQGWARLGVTTAGSVIVTGAMSWWLLLNSSMRQMVTEALRKRLYRKKQTD